MKQDISKKILLLFIFLSTSYLEAGKCYSKHQSMSDNFTDDPVFQDVLSDDEDFVDLDTIPSMSDDSTDDLAFQDALSDDEDPVDLDTIPFMSKRISAQALTSVTYDSSGILMGLERRSREHALVKRFDTGEVIREFVNYCNRTLQVCDRNNGQILFQWTRDESDMYAVSTDGEIEVKGTTPYGVTHISVTNPRTNSRIKKASIRGVYDITVSPDKTMIAVTSDGEVRLLHLTDDGHTVLPGPEYSSWVTVAFSADSNCIAVGGGDDGMRFYEIKERKLLWESPRSTCSLAFNSNGKMLALGGPAQSTILNACDGTPLYELCWSGKVKILFSPDDKEVVTVNADEVHVCRLAVLEKIFASFSPSERALLKERLDHQEGCEATLLVLNEIDDAMKGGQLAGSNQWTSTYCRRGFAMLPKSLQKAFGKYMAIEDDAEVTN